MCRGPLGTVFLATTISTPSSPLAIDHLLQPYLSTPHLQKRRPKQQQAKNSP